MKVRSFRGLKRPRGNNRRSLWHFTLKGEAGKLPRRALTVVGAVLALVLFAYSLRAEPVLMNSAEIATIWDNGVLRVGVRTDMPKLAENGEGFEVALAKLLAARIMSASGDKNAAKSVELVEVNPMNVSAKLTDGSIDAAICLMPRGVYSGFAYSRAYCAEDIYFLTRPGEENKAIKGIKIGCIQSASNTDLYVPSGATYNALLSYIEAHPDDGLSAKDSIVAYAAYGDLLDALSSGQVDVVALPSLLAEKYAAAYSFGISPTRAGALSYAVACLAEESAIASVADMMLAEMEEDGTLDALRAQYGLG